MYLKRPVSCMYLKRPVSSRHGCCRWLWCARCPSSSACLWRTTPYRSASPHRTVTCTATPRTTQRSTGTTQDWGPARSSRIFMVSGIVLLPWLLIASKWSRVTYCLRMCMLQSYGKKCICGWTYSRGSQELVCEWNWSFWKLQKMQEKSNWLVGNCVIAAFWKLQKMQEKSNWLIGNCVIAAFWKLQKMQEKSNWLIGNCVIAAFSSRSYWVGIIVTALFDPLCWHPCTGGTCHLTQKAASELTHLAPDCPSPPTLFPYRETCSLISAVVYYFQRCPLFKVRWSLRDAVNFQSCKMDTW